MVLVAWPARLVLLLGVSLSLGSSTVSADESIQGAWGWRRQQLVPLVDSKGSAGLLELQRVLKSPKRSFELKDLESIASAVVKAFDADQFEEAAFSHVSIKGPPLTLSDVRGACGSPKEREGLVKEMFKLARIREASNVETSRQLVRAALAIRGADPSNSYSGDQGFKEFESNLEFVARVIGKPLAEAVRKAESEYRTRQNSAVERYIPMAEAVAESIKARPASERTGEHVDAWIAGLDLLGEMDAGIDKAYIVVMTAWQGRCILRTWKEQEHCKRLEAAMTRCSERVSSPLTKRLLREAAQTDGEFPDGPAWVIIRHPDQIKNPNGP